jgi:MraZ protein
MTQFLGTHVGKLDKKGRISVPAAFRAALERIGTEDLVLRPSHRLPCIEAWPTPAFNALAEGLDRLDAFSDQHDDMAAALFADAFPARPDAEGRLVLPEELIRHAGLAEAVAFMGIGKTFQIWEPEAARRRSEEARMRARERGMTLPARAGAASGGATPINTTPGSVA